VNRALAFAAALLFCAAAAGAEPRFSFQSTPGKLPKEVVPKHYALRIVPAATHERFEGRAQIEIEVARPVAAIELNAVELDFDTARLYSGAGPTVLAAKFDRERETVTLAPETGAIAAGRYRLDIDYTGRIAKHPNGLHQVLYKQREGGQVVDRVMLATHMEPVHARRLFPGWDEPAFRASFEITAVVDEQLTAVSNMPVSAVTALSGGKKEVAFARSVPMPTYLVALFVGELDVLEDSVDGIALRIYTVKGKTDRARYAMQATKQIVPFFNEYFGVRYALPKLDQVAVPGGIWGAMENWGAINYNEARLLYDEAEPSLRQQQQVYGIIAHEVAHQWFGNLVTMAWWDNLWLNEGFASWMATKTAQRFYPDWKVRLRRALWRQEAMTDDARRTTHPIQTPVTDDARAMDVFDSITYSKGEAFIGMLESYLGEEVFRNGIRRYMQAHQYSNTTTADLWHHLSEASGREVATLAAPWTEQPGFPLVKVALRCANGRAVATLTQERFTLNDPKALRLTWKVPVTLADATGERRTVLLDRAPQRLRLARCGLIRVNVGDTGYYRVQYDKRSFSQLARELGRLEASDRLRVLADTFALMQAGWLDAGQYLALVDALGDEDDPRIWEHVIEALRFLRELIDAPADQAAFDRAVARVLGKPFARVGWSAQPNEGADRALLRRLLVDALGRAGDAATVREAQARFAARESKPIDAAVRPALLNVVGRYADEAQFEALLRSVRSATDAEIKAELRSALRHVSDPGRLRRWLGLLLATDELPPGDAVYDISRSGQDSGRNDLAWQFVRANLPAILAKGSPRGRAYVLPEAAAPAADAVRADELIALTRANLEPGAYYQAEKTADWIRLKAQVKAREMRRAVRWARGILGT
jgi:aminopeptidase N